MGIARSRWSTPAIDPSLGHTYSISSRDVFRPYDWKRSLVIFDFPQEIAVPPATHNDDGTLQDTSALQISIRDKHSLRLHKHPILDRPRHQILPVALKNHCSSTRRCSAACIPHRLPPLFAAYMQESLRSARPQLSVDSTASRLSARREAHGSPLTQYASK